MNMDEVGKSGALAFISNDSTPMLLITVLLGAFKASMCREAFCFEGRRLHDIYLHILAGVVLNVVLFNYHKMSQNAVL